MEQRKQKEIAHYDAHAQEWLSAHTDSKKQKSNNDFEGFEPRILASYRQCYTFLVQWAQGKSVLDFGCGNGVHLPYLAEVAASVTGIDLSAASLEIATHRIAHLPQCDTITLQKMDCEHLDFPDNTFDVVFDGGVFSSLDYDRALSEIARVLKPNGCLIGIETFGHNPATNFKRMLNKKSGKRTTWAADHILTTKSLEKAKHYFGDIEVRYFHLLSCAAFPFIGKPGGIAILRVLEVLDAALLSLPFLKKYAFKIVFVFSKPLKRPIIV